MNQEEMLKNCRYMLHALLKIRSNEAEQLNGVDEKAAKMVLNDLAPWTGGEKGKLVINSLQKVIDKNRVSGMEFYNFMTVAHKFDNGMIALWLKMTNNVDLPEPDSSMIVADLYGDL